MTHEHDHAHDHGPDCGCGHDHAPAADVPMDEATQAAFAEQLELFRRAGYGGDDGDPLGLGPMAWAAAVQIRMHVLRSLQVKELAARMARTGRNEPCPCGSGRKQKQCCAPLHPGTNQGPDPTRLQPEDLPHLSGLVARQDGLRLQQLLVEAPELSGVRVDPERATAFLETLAKDESAPARPDGEATVEWRRWLIGRVDTWVKETFPLLVTRLERGVRKRAERAPVSWEDRRALAMVILATEVGKQEPQATANLLMRIVAVSLHEAGQQDLPI